MEEFFKFLLTKDSKDKKGDKDKNWDKDVEIPAIDIDDEKGELEDKLPQEELVRKTRVNRRSPVDKRRIIKKH